MKNSTRMIRINEEIQKEVSQIIRGELKDPRIGTLTSVMGVDTTNDLKYCKIYVSIMGSEDQKKETLEGLKNASGFIRREIAKRINLRNTPEITFILDTSLEYGMRMNELFQDIHKEDAKS